MPEDFNGIAACLFQSSSLPTQLDIQLSGLHDNYDENRGSRGVNYVAVAAKAVRFIGPFCGPLTHITIGGKLELDSGGQFTPMLEAAAGVAASTLTHLLFTVEVDMCECDVEEELEMDELDVPQEERDSVSSVQLSDEAAAVLPSFMCLTHLHISCGSFTDELVWTALPPRLQSLTLRDMHCAPSWGILLPGLREINLQTSHCRELCRLLESSRKYPLKRLTLGKLLPPRNDQERVDLQTIKGNRLWCTSWC